MAIGEVYEWVNRQIYRHRERYGEGERRKRREKWKQNIEEDRHRERVLMSSWYNFVDLEGFCKYLFINIWYDFVYPFHIYKKNLCMSKIRNIVPYIKTWRPTNHKGELICPLRLHVLLGTVLHLLRWPGSVCAPCSYPLAPQDTGAAKCITCPFLTNPDPWFLGDVRSCTTLARPFTTPTHSIHAKYKGGEKPFSIRLFNRFCW